MRLKKCFLICLGVIVFSSCVENNGEIITAESLPINGDADSEGIYETLNAPLSLEEVRELLYTDDRVRRDNLEIVFLSKANFGIPGGDNWIVRFNTDLTIIYVINGRRIERQLYRGINLLPARINFDLMQDIPGTHITDGSSAFGDFNGDGIDELFWFSFGFSDVEISGYDPEIGHFVPLSAPLILTFPDVNYGPAPIQFMNYKGMYGFKAFILIPLGETHGKSWFPNPDPHAGMNIWVFYAWNAEQRMYMPVGRLIDGEMIME